MPSGKVFFVVGHEHWGKSETLRVITDDNPRGHRISINGKFFFVRHMSNDDQPDGYITFMNNASPVTKPFLVAALCPNFHNPQNGTESILAALRDKGYEMFFWVIKHQYNNTANVVTDEEIQRLHGFGTVEVFQQEVEAAERANSFRQFVSNVVA